MADPSTYSSTYIVRHDNAFDNPSTWAFTDWDEARKLRDFLNQHGGSGVDGEYHVEEEPHIPTAAEVIEELRADGWFDDE